MNSPIQNAVYGSAAQRNRINTGAAAAVFDNRQHSARETPLASFASTNQGPLKANASQSQAFLTLDANNYVQKESLYVIEDDFDRDQIYI